MLDCVRVPSRDQASKPAAFRPAPVSVSRSVESRSDSDE